MNLINKKILITGGYGFIGSYIFKKFYKKNKIVIIGKKKNIKNNSKNRITLENLYKLNFIPDVIFHCAGSGTVSEAQKDKKKSFEDDYQSTKNLVDFCIKIKKKITFIYISSAAVYKNNSKILKPTSIYGKNKLKSEKLLKKHLGNKIKLIIIRYFSIYGDGLKKQLLWDACNKILIKKKLTFFGNGHEKRSWLHISDAINIIVFLLKVFKKKIFVLDGHAYDVFKNKEIIEKIVMNLKIKNNIKFNNKKQNFVPDNQISRCNKLKNLGWKPKINLDKGIKKYILWFLKYKKINR